MFRDFPTLWLAHKDGFGLPYPGAWMDQPWPVAYALTLFCTRYNGRRRRRASHIGRYDSRQAAGGAWSALPAPARAVAMPGEGEIGELGQEIIEILLEHSEKVAERLSALRES